MDERIDEFGDGIGVGRDVDARAGFAHLMLVEPELREPVVVDHVVHVFSFDLREHEPVAVVVMANVVVIEVRHGAALVFGAEIFAVPLGDHGFAIGIERGDEENDGVVEAGKVFGILGGGEMIGPFHGHLAGADFRGVNVAGDKEDGFAVVGECVDLLWSEAAGVGKFMRDVFVPGFVGEVFWSGDYGHEHIFAEGGLAEDFYLHAWGCGGKSLEIGGDLFVVGELAVGADFEAEEFAGLGDGASGFLFFLSVREGKQRTGQNSGEKSSQFKHERLLWEDEKRNSMHPEYRFWRGEGARSSGWVGEQKVRLIEPKWLRS